VAPQFFLPRTPRKGDQQQHDVACGVDEYPVLVLFLVLLGSSWTAAAAVVRQALNSWYL